MASYGYQSDHINLITDNLRDRYKSGFPILKELIQNVDDAKARQLIFSLHPPPFRFSFSLHLNLALFRNMVEFVLIK
jgi:hypothetical protein